MINKSIIRIGYSVKEDGKDYFLDHCNDFFGCHYTNPFLTKTELVEYITQLKLKDSQILELRNGIENSEIIFKSPLVVPLDEKEFSSIISLSGLEKLTTIV